MIQPYNFSRYRSLLIEKFCVTPADFDEQYMAWKGRSEGAVDSEKQFVWQFLEQWTRVLPGKYPDPYERFKQLQAFYLLMWSYLIVEQKKGTAMLALANHFELMAAELSTFKTYVMIIGGQQCAAAELVDGLAVPLEDALLEQPIPYANCSRPLGCICSYGIHGERDLEGNLITK
jgi:hypothetical protein